MEALLQATPAPMPPPQISPPELSSFSTGGVLPFSYMNSTTTYALSSSQGFNDRPQASTLASTSGGLQFDPTNLFGTGNSPSFFGQPFDPAQALGTAAFDASSISFASAEATFGFSKTTPSTSTELLPFGWPEDVSSYDLQLSYAMAEPTTFQLPPPSLLFRLVDAFFLRTESMHGHEMVQMVHQGKIQSALRLPPTHVNFRESTQAGSTSREGERANLLFHSYTHVASVCLLHSMAATAVKRLPEAALASDTRSWTSAEEFALFHVEKARGMIDACFRQHPGRKHLQVRTCCTLP